MNSSTCWMICNKWHTAASMVVSAQLQCNGPIVNTATVQHCFTSLPPLVWAAYISGAVLIGQLTPLEQFHLPASECYRGTPFFWGGGGRAVSIRPTAVYSSSTRQQCKAVQSSTYQANCSTQQQYKGQQVSSSLANWAQVSK